jgi:hypothetical protein
MPAVTISLIVLSTTGRPAAPELWRMQRIEVTGFCRTLKQCPARFSGKTVSHSGICRKPMHIALAQALLPSL